MKSEKNCFQVSGLLGEKDETIRQLELKLSTACNQRERAEARCGEALEENSKMRSDLAILAAQVKGNLLCVCRLFAVDRGVAVLLLFVAAIGLSGHDRNLG